MSLGQRVRDRREELGLSRKELVQRTGLSYPYVSQIETDDRTPTLVTVEKLATALELPLDALLSEGQPVAPVPPATLPRSFDNPAFAGASAVAAAPPEDLLSALLAVLDRVPVERRLGLLGDATTHVLQQLVAPRTRRR